MTGDADVLSELLERCRRDHHAWINGDGSAYALPDDGTVMGAVGGWARGGEQTSARQLEVARQFRDGTGDVELVGGAVVGGLAWLASVREVAALLTPGTKPDKIT